MEETNEPVSSLTDLLCLTTKLSENNKIKADDLNLNDPHRQKWIKEALSSIFVDVPKEITKALNEIKNLLNNDSKEKAEDICCILDDLREICFDINSSLDLFKIGGIPILESLTIYPDENIQKSSLNCIAVIFQNNIDLQEEFYIDKIPDYFNRFINSFKNDDICKSLLSVLLSFVSGFEKGAKVLASLFFKERMLTNIIESIPFSCTVKFLRLIIAMLFTDFHDTFLHLDVKFFTFLSNMKFDEQTAELCASIVQNLIQNKPINSSLNYSLLILIDKIYQFLDEENRTKIDSIIKILQK